MTKELRVAVIDDYQRAAYAMTNWTSAGRDVHVTYYHDHVSDPDQLVARLRGFDVIVAMRERTAFPRDLLRQLPSLRLLVTTGRINAAIDVPAARALGIVVSGTNAPAAVIGATELAWALIFAVARGIPMEDAAVRHGG